MTLVDGKGNERPAKHRQFHDICCPLHWSAGYLLISRNTGGHHQIPSLHCLPLPNHCSPKDCRGCTSYRWAPMSRPTPYRAASSISAQAIPDMHFSPVQYWSASRYHCPRNSRTWREFAIQSVHRGLSNAMRENKLNERKIIQWYFHF